MIPYILMKRLLNILLPLCMSGAAIFAADITGLVIDEEQQPLSGASLSLTSPSDSLFRQFTFADEDGKFAFKDVGPGQYYLEASMLSMSSKVVNVSVEDSTTNLEIPTIILAQEGKTLQETVVTAIKSAVIARQDTLEYNAGSYHTNPNASVGDLLKKLPGVEVSSDGSITSGGKSVSKILVDGKEFFSDDPTMATKNLPSEMVEKVQVIDRKSDLARLTGVDDGEEETVINLTVKKNMKEGWFGTVGGGYGTDGRYEGNFNISTFTNDNQFSFVGGANNINDLGFSDRGRGRFMSFGPSGGITDSQRFGVNFNVGNGEKFRVGGNVFYSHTNRNADNYSETQYLYPDSVSFGKSGSHSIDKGHALNGNFRMLWNIDDNNTLEFRPTFYYNNRKSASNDSTMLYTGDFTSQQVNSTQNFKANRGDSYSVSGSLIFNHKFASRPGRSFSAQLQYSYSNTTEHTTSLSDMEFMLLQDESETLYRYLDTKQRSNTGSARLTWTEPLGDVARGNFLTAAYRIGFTNSDADKLTYNLPPDLLPAYTDITALTAPPAGYLPSDSLSNEFRNRFLNQELRLGYKKVSSMYNLEAGMVFAPSRSKSYDLINSARNLAPRTVWNVAPFLRFSYKFSKTSSLRINYNARTSQASSKQLQPVADVSDPMNIVIGNPELKPTFTQNIMAHFNNYNNDTQQSIMAMANVSYALNSIVSRTISNPETGARTTTYANTNGNLNLMGMFFINQPLPNRRWRYNVNMRVRYSSMPGYINGDFNRSGNLSLSPRAGMTFSCDIFQMSVNPHYSFSMATNSLPRQANQYIHEYGFDADASLYLPFGLQISSDINFNSPKGYAGGFNSNEWLWNAQISYSFLRDKSLTVSAKVYDLLGMKKNVERTVSANMISDSRYNALTRYFMFGVSYTFNTLKNKGGKNTGISDGPMPPPPGGGMRTTPGGAPHGRPPF